MNEPCLHEQIHGSSMAVVRVGACKKIIPASCTLHFCGYLDVYKRQDPVFWKAFINNVCYTIGILIFGVAPGLLLAYILSRPGIKGRTLFRSVYFFPRIISAVV